MAQPSKLHIKPTLLFFDFLFFSSFWPGYVYAEHCLPSQASLETRPRVLSGPAAVLGLLVAPKLGGSLNECVCGHEVS